MDFQKMLETENTDSLYHSWADYRKELTHYIVSSVEELYIMKKLSDSHKLRIHGMYNMKNIIEELGNKPTLAIWGAGGCNDIDIVRLSKSFKLVLIDHNIDSIKNARARFGLSKDECLCIDLNFWDISMDDYKMFDALLMDGAGTHDIEGFLKELVKKNSNPDYSKLPHFDYSVAVGLASQLNSRFAAILHMYNVRCSNDSHYLRVNSYSEDDIRYIYDIIRNLNYVAVEYMLEAISTMTDKGIVIGYEVNVFDGSMGSEMTLQIETLNEEKEHLFNPWMDNITISGNIELENGIRYRVEELEKFVLVNRKAMNWTFLHGKNYLMIFRTMEKSD